MLRKLLHSEVAVKQPTPDVTSGDVERIIRREFSELQFGEVMAILGEYGIEPGEGECIRVRLAILKLAHGDLRELRMHVSSAKQDFRDIIVAAEYPGYRNAGMTWLLPPQQKQGIIENDWRQYECWLRK